MWRTVLAMMLAAAAQAAEPGLRVTACFEFEHTAVGNPASARTTDCIAQQISGPDPAGVFERQWSAIVAGGDKATALCRDPLLSLTSVGVG
ncbi:MAG: hypothetical protein HY303_09730 [Candidatus Wallbacteria bacterium]|nr:hypothetical protein [Candidatus Wallbacteria bacterium]